MTVKGWLIVGGQEISYGLPPTASGGFALGTPPNAAGHDVGTWLVWEPSPYTKVTLVCVELSL